MIAIEVTDLPEPDSPTMPSTSPGRSANDTPRTACTTPSSVGKRTLRSSTSSTASVLDRRCSAVVSVKVAMVLRFASSGPDGQGRRSDAQARTRVADGSNASRMPSPIRLIDITMIRMARPGK